MVVDDHLTKRFVYFLFALGQNRFAESNAVGILQLRFKFVAIDIDVISDIPMVDQVDLAQISTGDRVTVSGARVTVEKTDPDSSR